MAPPFNWRGYTAVDPLDRAPGPMRFVLTIAVSTIVASLFLYVQRDVYHVVGFSRWVFWIGVGLYGVGMGSLLVVLRKSSSLLFYLIIVGLAVPVDLFLEAHCRPYPKTAWWTYVDGGLLSPVPVPLRFLVAWSIDGLIQGPFVLWLARLLADLIYPASKSEAAPTFEQNQALFPSEWTDEPVDKPARDAGYWWLRLFGLGYFTYMVFGLIGALGSSPWPGPLKSSIDLTYWNPALAIDTFSKISLMVLLSFVGAYNRNVRWHCVLGLIAGHSVSVAASLSFCFGADHDTFQRYSLLASAIVDGGMVLVFAWLLVRHRHDARQFAPLREPVDFVSQPDKLLKLFFYLLSAIMALSVVGAVMLRVYRDGSSGPGAVYGYPDPQLSNSITRFSTIAVLAFLLAKRETLRDYFTSILLAAFAVTIVGNSVLLLLGTPAGRTRIYTRGGGPAVHVDWFFGLQIAVYAAIVALLIGLRKMSYKVDYVVNVLNPSSAQNVIALHQAFHGDSAVNDSAVLAKIDRYIADIRGPKRGLLNFPFWIVEHLLSPVFGLHPTFSNMSSSEGRYFLRKYSLRPPRERARAFVPLLADFAARIGGAVQAFVTVAHYTTIRGWEEIGYIPPDARDRLQGDFPAYPAPSREPAALPHHHREATNFKPALPPPRPLAAPRVSMPFAEPQIPDDVDYLIVGSGAGGAPMAFRLACGVKDPGRILVVDTGRRYSPLEDFNDDEMQMIPMLYKDGGLQASKRFDLRVLQAECVGGGTVINNAICLRMPTTTRDTWAKDYGLRLSELDDTEDDNGQGIKPGEYSRIAEEIDITRIPDVAINHLVAEKFEAGVAGLNGADLSRPQRLWANQRNMVGDGLCNLGNKRLRKRSMLETYLPWAEARGVKVIGETTALGFVRGERGNRAEAVFLRMRHGDTKRVRVRKAVIVAAGTIASSQFLIRSGVRTNVGQGMSCNFAFPVAFEFQDRLDAFDGAQITLGAFDVDNRASFETYFNPPGAFALSLPFCFNRADNLMKRYRYLVNFGALVGSESNGTIEVPGDPVSRRPFTSRSFSWRLGHRDRDNIKYAMTTLLELGLAAKATRCVLPTEPGIELRLTRDNVLRFKQEIANYPLTMADLRLTTAHPQGGNRMVADCSPQRSQRVVNQDFRVDGLENVFVADASIFPTGITVNPQWTIMGLSSLAAARIISVCEE